MGVKAPLKSSVFSRLRMNFLILQGTVFVLPANICKVKHCFFAFVQKDAVLLIPLVIHHLRRLLFLLLHRQFYLAPVVAGGIDEIVDMNDIDVAAALNLLAVFYT